MIAAILIRNYKNYANLNFISIANDIENISLCLLAIME